MEIIKHLNSHQFSIIARPEEYSVCYEIYNHEGYGDDGEPMFASKGSKPFEDTTDIYSAEMYAHGHVKWDGCSNWYFDEQDRCMLHGCCRQDILRYGVILAFCWEWTKTLCENWCD